MALRESASCMPRYANIRWKGSRGKRLGIASSIYLQKRAALHSMTQAIPPFRRSTHSPQVAARRCAASPKNDDSANFVQRSRRQCADVDVAACGLTRRGFAAQQITSYHTRRQNPSMNLAWFLELD